MMVIMPLILFLYAGSIIAYSQKKDLTPKDYDRWSSLSNPIITGNAKWVSYVINHKEGKDTLYLKNRFTNILYSYPKAKSGSFSPDSKWFGCMSRDTLNLLELSSGKKFVFTGFSEFKFTIAGHYLLGTLNKQDVKSLWLKNLATMDTLLIKNVGEYNLNSDRSLLAFTTNDTGTNTLKTIQLEPKLISKTIKSDTAYYYMGIVWGKQGKSIAFYEVQGEKGIYPKFKKVYCCSNLDGKPLLKALDPLRVSGFPKEAYFSTNTLYLSDDNKQVFIDLGNPQPKNKVRPIPGKDIGDVQIWNTDDNEVPPPKVENTSEVKWYVWWTDKEKLVQVEDDEHPNVILTGDQKNALVYNDNEYLPHYKGDYMDVYLKDLWSGNIKLIVKKQHKANNQMLVSPTGKYITYFKEGNWWVYDISKDSHKCVTAGLGVAFENLEYDFAGTKPPHGNPGWLSNDNQLILYDEYDIWMVKPDGSKKIKITEGRKNNIVYRINVPEYRMYTRSSFFGFVADSFDEQKGMLLQTFDKNTLAQGFSYWTGNSGMSQLFEKDRKLTIFSKAAYKQAFLFLESDFDIPPRLMVYDPSRQQQQLIYQTNPQQQEYNWGRSELVHYTLGNGRQLKGALHYPANYDPSKKYPMIVHIYEKKSNELHNYTAPSELLSDGFNTTNYTTNGYFVFHPDISYTLNEPGVSATNCVVAAVEKVLKKGIVDSDRIGLIGFSFGGYETAFIISQTNLFKAAVAGGGYHDPTGFYLSIGGYGQSNIWRFEDSQQRMQAPFYGSEFQGNSTLFHVNQINTPLLLWTGNMDPQVEWTESRKLQIALWRLHKKSTLLVYPDEGHGLMKETNQKDLNRRIRNWFDSYLK